MATKSAKHSEGSESKSAQPSVWCSRGATPRSLHTRTNPPPRILAAFPNRNSSAFRRFFPSFAKASAFAEATADKTEGAARLTGAICPGYTKPAEPSPKPNHAASMDVRKHGGTTDAGPLPPRGKPATLP